ncbi:mortality factor 4-like protein 1 [Fistulifera solaris]|uniref:Mortality factor 4-like protein 1 n=1 Tax=Fistulifera solaris TaxID=1519565 RepID=A0A1Z5JN17_FISSO|nr:mortality factor 4-like protein 1 [Fistulifera solaris]|eukprot:GAX15359.1 mortality factor 4-like protein 1 [Fistulifera solaris]
MHGPSSVSETSSTSLGLTNGAPMELDGVKEDEMSIAENNNDQMDEPFSAVRKSTPPFQIDQRVYAADKTEKGAFYEAIIRKVRALSPDEWEFLVHYQGWNARWDRWVSCDWLQPDTPENRLKYQQQQTQHNEEKVSSAEKTNKKRKSSNEQPFTSRRRLSNTSCTRSVDLKYLYSDYCELPFTLKTVLVDEYEKITRCGWDCKYRRDSPMKYTKPARMVHCLPAPVPVRKVLTHFRKRKLKYLAKQAEVSENTAPSAPTAEDIQTFCEQLELLFQKALPTLLLYPEERPQFEEFKATVPDDANWIDYFGCEYLLRLYVRLPVLLQIERHSIETTRNVVGPLLAELLVLMQKNRQALFPNIGNCRAVLPNEWQGWEYAVYRSKNNKQSSENAS